MEEKFFPDFCGEKTERKEKVSLSYILVPSIPIHPSIHPSSHPPNSDVMKASSSRESSEALNSGDRVSRVGKRKKQANDATVGRSVGRKPSGPATEAASTTRLQPPEQAEALGLLNEHGY